MISHQIGAFLALLIVSLAVPVVLFLLLRDSLRELLQHTVKLSGGDYLLFAVLSAGPVPLGAFGRSGNVLRPET